MANKKPGSTYLSNLVRRGLLVNLGRVVRSADCGKGDRAGKGNPWLEKIVRASVRAADPWWEVRRGWLVRRLAPDCSRIDIDELVHHRDLASLLHAMGAETANIHLGSAKAKTILTHLARQPGRWLADAASHMANVVRREFRDLSQEQE